MDRLLRWVQGILKCGVPVVAFVIVVAAVIEHAHRWPVAADTLRQYPGDTPILVGFSYRFAGSRWERFASYVLVPSVFTQPRVITVRAGSSAGPTVKTSSALGSFLWLGACFGGSLWLWFRRRATSNRLERSRVASSVSQGGDR
jgi:hypothetical protein